MTDCMKSAINSDVAPPAPQCEHFVVRKKRLCRMTVKPGRRYCGEHEPEPPRAADGQADARIPCPYDPKHTCYASRLEKHLSVCNARAGELPPYIQHNVNAPQGGPHARRTPLAEVSRETLMQVIDKVNTLYEKYIAGTIYTVPSLPAHAQVSPELGQRARGERSRRQLRQASALLRLAERQGLVRPGTCYVELGAGKGQLSYYMCRAWCARGTGSRVVLVDRAALRHKRDNRLRGEATRLRADVAHVALREVPAARDADHVVGLAKHLCGVATDYALQCLTAGAGGVTLGCVVATCCHHRCEWRHYFGAAQLQALGITGEDFNVMLGVASWATCGDGRSRGRGGDAGGGGGDGGGGPSGEVTPEKDQNNDPETRHSTVEPEATPGGPLLALEARAAAGRRAKALVDWARAAELRARGLHARLARYVPADVSPENLCIVATRHPPVDF